MRVAGCELVGGTGNEVALGGEGGLQTSQQSVDDLAEVFELVIGSWHGQPLVQVVFGDRPDRDGHLPQRPQYPAAISQPSATEATVMMPSAIADSTRNWFSAVAWSAAIWATRSRVAVRNAGAPRGPVPGGLTTDYARAGCGPGSW